MERNNLNRLIREQFCREAGDPCEYSGRSMAETHGGLGLRAKEFDAFVEDFIDAMEDLKLPYRTQNRMLRIFAPMRADVIDGSSSTNQSAPKPLRKIASSIESSGQPASYSTRIAVTMSCIAACERWPGVCAP